MKKLTPGVYTREIDFSVPFTQVKDLKIKDLFEQAKLYYNNNVFNYYYRKECYAYWLNGIIRKISKFHEEKANVIYF